MNAEQLAQAWCDPKFRPCVDAFASSFGEGGELGAACAAYVDGKLAFDVWGGFANPQGEIWCRDTATPVASITKGVSALALLTLVDQGKLDLDEAVARYWPEFGVHGKEHVTVRQALAHRAGVPVVSGPVTLNDLRNIVGMSSRLAEEVPVFEPNSTHSYHPLTIGWITSELCRRVTGRNIGEWIRSELSARYDLHLQIGRRAGDAPVATLTAPPEHDTVDFPPDSIPARAMSLNDLFAPKMRGMAAAMNSAEVQQVELAGANCISDARSLAKLYSKTVSNTPDRLFGQDRLKDALRIQSSGKQWGVDLPGPNWSAGLMVPFSYQPMMGQGSFGHDGAGGVLAFAHAPSQVSFAYVRNRMGQPAITDPFVYRVVNALADCLGVTVDATEHQNVD